MIRYLFTLITILLPLFAISQEDFINYPDKHLKEHTIREIDLSNNHILGIILDDVICEDSIIYNKDNYYYDINIQDYKSGSLISINRLPLYLKKTKENNIGFANYKGHFFMVNGEGQFTQELCVLNESITFKDSDKGPVPDGVFNRTYYIEDDLCFRHFMGMGLMFLSDSLHEKVPFVNLPKRKK